MLAVRHLGGAIRPVEPFYGWNLAQRDARPDEALRQHAPELVGETVHISDFHGVVVIDVGHQRYLALRTDVQVVPAYHERIVLLAGPSVEATLRLADRITRTLRDVLGTHSIQVYGTPLIVNRTVAVPETDLILPESFKADMFGYLDAFWRSAAVCDRMGIPATRGVLFVGAPGTGKTQTIRCFVARYPRCRYFLFAPEAERSSDGRGLFGLMLQHVEEGEGPAVIVIEDIDRLFQEGAVSRQFLLNALDGLFRPQRPVLWVATSNDPEGLEQNLLDRPGRFDRIFVFPRPGLPERQRLIDRYSPWPVDRRTVEAIAEGAEGLTGAHIREVCYAAALDAAEEPAQFGQALHRELGRVREQHVKARSYHLEIAGQRTPGFRQASQP